MVNIQLKQYRAYGNKRIVVQPTTKSNSTSGSTATQKAVVEEKRPTTGKETPKTYTVVKGDTLWAICQKELGDGSKYPEIAKLNNISNPNVIKEGQVIKLG